MPERKGYLPIADYGVIGNCVTAALVSSHGSIDWLCAPRFDSPSLFGRLLDAQHGGYWLIQPTGDYHATHHYVENTTVLVTRFLSNDGVAQVTDFMPIQATTSGEDSETGAPHLLVRIVECLTGTIDLENVCAPRPDYGRVPLTLQATGLDLTAGSWTLTTPPDTSWQIDDAAGTARTLHTLAAGQALTFVLHLTPGVQRPSANPDAALHSTIDYWQTWATTCTYEGPYRGEVIRSALTLKLLIDADSGAILAAPTTSLPEQPGGPLNWDYRYAWLRDASFTLYALLLAGFTDETQRFFRWIADTVAVDKEGIRLMYTVSPDETLDETVLDHWEGYQGARPIRIGNAAAGQLQLDIYGEVLDALFFAWKAGAFDPSSVWEHFVPIVDWIAAHWREPDNGIWERRDERRHYVYSKIMSWVALDRGIKIAQGNNLRGDCDRWQDERDACRAEVFERGWSESLHSFKESYERERLDAALLRALPVGFISGDDPRMTATVEAIIERLVANGLCYRYLGPPEGTFLACTFWLINALVLSGQGQRARDLFDNVLHYASPLGLYAEEMDPSSRQLWGNFPQALSHIGVINAAVTLAQAGIVGAVRDEHAAAAADAREGAKHTNRS